MKSFQDKEDDLLVKEAILELTQSLTALTNLLEVKGVITSEEFDTLRKVVREHTPVISLITDELVSARRFNEIAAKSTITKEEADFLTKYCKEADREEAVNHILQYKKIEG